MRNPLILVFSVLAFLSLATLGGRFPSAENPQKLASSQLATPYAQGWHLARNFNTPERNFLLLGGDYLWRFVYFWNYEDGRWERSDLAETTGLRQGNYPLALSEVDNRYIILGRGGNITPDVPRNVSHVAFYSTTYRDGEWCGGCDQEGARGKWQVFQIAPSYVSADWVVPQGNDTFLLNRVPTEQFLHYPLSHLKTFVLWRKASSADDYTLPNLQGTELAFTLYGPWNPDDFFWSLKISSAQRSFEGRRAQIIVERPTEITEHRIRFTLPNTEALRDANDFSPLYLKDGEYYEIFWVDLYAEGKDLLNERLAALREVTFLPFLVTFGAEDVSFPFLAQVASKGKNSLAYDTVVDYVPPADTRDEQIPISAAAEFIREARRTLPQDLDVAEMVFSLLAPDFGTIARAAVSADVPLGDMIRAFDKAGYLRQGVRAAISGGAEPMDVLRALYNAKIGVDQVRQMRNEFLALSYNEFRSLVRDVGYDTDGVEFFTPSGIRVPGDNRTYRHIQLQAAYLPGLETRSEQEIQYSEYVMSEVLSDVTAFYERELRGAVDVGFQIHPRPIRWGNPLSYNTPAEQFTALFSAFSDSSSEWYNARFVRNELDTYYIFVLFMDETDPLAEGYGDYIPQPFAVITNFAHPTGEIVKITAHEVGHALSFPHSWQTIGSPDITASGWATFSAFRSVRGNIMGYATGVSGFDTLFLTDDIANLILVGEEPSLRGEEKGRPHADPVLFSGSRESQNDVRRYVARENAAGFSDAQIIERLLADGVLPQIIIRSYDGLERGVERIIAVAVERFPLENILRSFRNAGFTNEEMKLARINRFFFDAGVSPDDYFRNVDYIFPP